MFLSNIGNRPNNINADETPSMDDSEVAETNSATAGKDVGEQWDQQIVRKGAGEPTIVYRDDVRVDTGRNHARVDLYDVTEVQALIRLTRKGTINWIRTNVTPLGGTTWVGNRILVHAWALNAALDAKRHQPSRHKKGGRPRSLQRYWEKKLKK